MELAHDDVSQAASDLFARMDAQNQPSPGADDAAVCAEPLDSTVTDPAVMQQTFGHYTDPPANENTDSDQGSAYNKLLAEEQTRRETRAAQGYRDRGPEIPGTCNANVVLDAALMVVPGGELPEMVQMASDVAEMQGEEDTCKYQPLPELGGPVCKETNFQPANGLPVESDDGPNSCQ